MSYEVIDFGLEEVVGKTTISPEQYAQLQKCAIDEELYLLGQIPGYEVLITSRFPANTLVMLREQSRVES